MTAVGATTKHLTDASDHREQQLIERAVGDGDQVVRYGLRRIVAELEIFENAFDSASWELVDPDTYQSVIRGLGDRLAVLAEYAARDADRLHELEQAAKDATTPASTKVVRLDARRSAPAARTSRRRVKRAKGGT